MMFNDDSGNGSMKTDAKGGKQANTAWTIATMSKPGPKSKLTQTHHAGVYKADSVKVRNPSLGETSIEMARRIRPSL